MLLSGVQKFTLLDYPDKVACIAFLPGCNMRCGYCHNPEFVLPEQIKKIKSSFIADDVFFNFLARRQNVLDGVVISGGEPTVHALLPEFIQRVKTLGFLVKLDTNGNNPVMLEQLIKDTLVDYVAMDIKTSLERYEELAGTCVRPEHIQKSITMLIHSGIDYEFRTTLIREVHDINTLQTMASQAHGAQRWFLQEFRNRHTLNPKFQTYRAYTHEEMEQLARNVFARHVQNVFVRT